MKTERLNLLISPEDKAAIARRAASLDLSTSELVRRAVSAYEPEHGDLEFQELVSAFLGSVERTEAALDRVLNRLDTMEDRLEQVRRETRERVREHVAAGEVSWPFRTPSGAARS